MAMKDFDRNTIRKVSRPGVRNFLTLVRSVSTFWGWNPCPLSSRSFAFPSARVFVFSYFDWHIWNGCWKICPLRSCPFTLEEYSHWVWNSSVAVTSSQQTNTIIHWYLSSIVTVEQSDVNLTILLEIIYQPPFFCLQYWILLFYFIHVCMYVFAVLLGYKVKHSYWLSYTNCYTDQIITQILSLRKYDN